MKKSLLVFVCAAWCSVAAWAQSVQDGVNNLYAERYQSARTAFEKLTASNPNNLEAQYWLGQTHLAQGNTAAARQVYEKVLAANGNAPMVLAGMGHVELIEGKTAEARQRFETAISLSRGKKGDDPMVLNAIGRANVESKTGDIPYAIQKLTQASQLAPNNADIWINLGNAYRKAKDGGQAVTAYNKALQTAPALANYRIARIYETQRNWEVYNDHLNRAIQADPRFAPALSQQYFYNLLYKKDFPAAEALAQKVIAASDPSVNNDYFLAQTKYLQKQYDEAIRMGTNIASQAGESVNPRVFRLIAYSQLEKGDTSAALTAVDQFFAKAKDEDIVAQDYTLKATAYSKDKPNEVINIYLAAAASDTSLRNKVNILNEALDWAKANNKKVPEADIRLAIYNLNPNRNPASFISMAIPYYQGGAFTKADSTARAYAAAFPDSTYGYLWSARSLGRIDSTLSQGLAVPQYEKLLEVAGRGDKVRNKAAGVEAAGYLANYYVNFKSDKEKGIQYLSKGLEFDPTNAAFTGALERLRKPAAPVRKPAAPAPKTKNSTAAAKPKK